MEYQTTLFTKKIDVDILFIFDSQYQKEKKLFILNQKIPNDLNYDTYFVLSKNRKNTKEVKNSRNELIEYIDINKPKKIITFGHIPLYTLINEKISVTEKNIDTFAGHKIPDYQYKTWIFPNYNIVGLGDNIIKEKYFDRYLKEALNWDTSWQSIMNINYIEYVNDISILQNEKIIAFDIETTGLRPQRKGHEIICIAMSTKNKTYVTENIKSAESILKDKNIKKIAHNLQFEDMWCEVNGWFWDTQLATHLLDNRTGNKSLKFQGYVNFGFAGYDKEVKPYLKAKTIHDFNRVKEFDRAKLRRYCGIDAQLTFHLAEKQFEQMTDKTGMNFFMNGEIELSKISKTGINIDINYYNEIREVLNEKIDKYRNKIYESNEAKTWKQRENKELDILSSQQLCKLLIDCLGIDTGKRTKKGNVSIDNEALKNINTRFTKDVLEYRKYYKLKNTYVDGFVDCSENSKLYPSFNLSLVKSLRSSSSNPNFQNNPNRDKESNKIVRSGIVPSKGNQLLEADYSRIEVVVSSCYHKDPQMIKYIENPVSDMHRDQAAEIFMLNVNDVTEEMRHFGKNGFVFPQFYGSYYRQCALNIWKQCSNEIKNHLESVGIKHYRHFENHLKEIENIFWNKKFRKYTEWKEQNWYEYQKNGYIKSLTGFTYSGIMTKREANNYPIQGAAFHCLLWSLIQLNKMLENYKTNIIGQIHDSIVFDICPNELEELKPIIRKIMCEDIRDYWKWIIVPLNIEAEITEINGNWSEKKAIKI